MTIQTYPVTQIFILLIQPIGKIEEMGRRKTPAIGRVSAKKKWREAHKAQPRKIYGRQTKEYRRKTSKSKAIDEAPIIKHKIDPAWTTEYVNGPDIPVSAPIEPWYKINTDGRRKEVKEKNRWLEYGRQLPDVQIIRPMASSNWWDNLPDVVSMIK